MRGRNRDIREILEYCAARGIRILVTFSRKLTIPPDYTNKIKIIRLKSGRKRNINKIIATLFMNLGSEEKN